MRGAREKELFPALRSFACLLNTSVRASMLIAEASGERQIEKLGPTRLGAYQATAALIRYNGPAHWALSDAAKVEVFFTARFNHTLPISAFGQTAVHDHLGFDHRNAMDVA